ncbi:TetR/AcrR family transcriptional regulator [Actinomycetospora termitidis]|uniref:TetR/AcrR family transcriptional regulator n=1 Tax=Actinomycetospora termitidis TaxID=3053470 RepID=A0ABT7M1S5_9PSEU|nr:TetR/AcrR family transcriptional regulator [Actinomycetospora sp. Odt1-22]MDL5154608.1 TetR/AcrR family transcriptional regulator [Actinomycetospora sp. Odt1-22]
MSPRADARLNRDALLRSASELFASDGPDVALDKVARDAGVSIATLYRHFPHREALVAATYAREIAELGEVPDDGSGSVALARWLLRFVEFARTKRALGDLLHAPGADHPPARTVISAAITDILARGAADGTLRDDRDADDVIALLAGLWTLPADDSWPQRADRLAGFVLDGLTVPTRSVSP